MRQKDFDEPALAGLGGRWVRFFIATRPGFLGASGVPVFIGLAAVCAQGNDVDVWLASLTLLAIVFVHAGVNVLNDYYDDAAGSDVINTDRVYPFTGGSRVIQTGMIQPAQMAILGGALLLAGGIIGLYLAMRSGAGLFLIGFLGIGLGWAYSAFPFRLSDRGAGEVSVAIGFGSLIPLGAYYVQTGVASNTPVIIALPYALLVASLLFMNQFPDIRADTTSRKRNWVVRLGSAQARWAYAGLILLAYGSLLLEITLGVLPALSWLAALPFTLNAAAALQLYKFHAQPSRLRPAIKMTIAATMSHGLTLALVLVIARA